MSFQILKRARGKKKEIVWADTRALRNYGVAGTDARLEFSVGGFDYSLLLDKESFERWARHVLPDLFPK